MRRGVLDCIIALFSLAVCILTAVYWREQVWLIWVSGSLAVIFLILAYFGRDRQLVFGKEKVHVSDGTVKQLVLLSEEDTELYSWDLFGRTSLVIGRDIGENDVDIDLSNVTYAGFISVEHAVLNFAGDHWYIEDLHSENGVRVQKKGDTHQYRLAPDKPCMLDIGDAVFIAQTKLQVR